MELCESFFKTSSKEQQQQRVPLVCLKKLFQVGWIKGKTTLTDTFKCRQS